MDYIPFTKRGKKPPTPSDDMSEIARKRVWHHLAQLSGGEDKLLEFLEFLFQVEYFQQAVDTAVEAINAAFRGEGVGYRFSERIVNQITIPNTGGAYRYEITPPIAMKTSEDATHKDTIQPALHA